MAEDMAMRSEGDAGTDEEFEATVYSTSDFKEVGGRSRKKKYFYGTIVIRSRRLTRLIGRRVTVTVGKAKKA